MLKYSKAQESISFRSSSFNIRDSKEGNFEFNTRYHISPQRQIIPVHFSFSLSNACVIFTISKIRLFIISEKGLAAVQLLWRPHSVLKKISTRVFIYKLNDHFNSPSIDNPHLKDIWLHCFQKKRKY